MKIVVQVEDPFVAEVNPKLVERALRSTLQRFSTTRATTLTVVITDNETIQQLNHEYRGINSPTDVLSFANTPDPDFPEMDQGHLGDVIIAYPVAQGQALTGGHRPMDEILLLAIHGTLHLLGFDHDSPLQKQEMWAIQAEIMTELGLAHIHPTES